jgi:hypothetical protein
MIFGDPSRPFRESVRSQTVREGKHFLGLAQLPAAPALKIKKA